VATASAVKTEMTATLRLPVIRNPTMRWMAHPANLINLNRQLPK